MSLINASDISKKNKNQSLSKVNKIREQLVSNDYEFLEIFYNYIEMQDLESAKEISFEHLKDVVAELSIKFTYDIEGVLELINAKHAHLVGISYPLFKENLLEWLENQQKVLSNTVMVGDSVNKIGPGNMSSINKLKNSMNKSMEGRENNPLNYSKDFDFSEEVDVTMIILHRSLYLLKRKFEENETGVRDIYRHYSTRIKEGLEVETRNFYVVLETIMKEAGFSFTEIFRPSELFKIEVLEKINQDKVVVILKELRKYMEANREKYNTLMKEKKGFAEDDEIKSKKSEEVVSMGSKDKYSVKTKKTQSELEKEIKNPDVNTDDDKKGSGSDSSLEKIKNSNSNIKSKNEKDSKAKSNTVKDSKTENKVDKNKKTTSNIDKNSSKDKIDKGTASKLKDTKDSKLNKTSSKKDLSKAESRKNTSVKDIPSKTSSKNNLKPVASNTKDLNKGKVSKEEKKEGESKDVKETENQEQSEMELNTAVIPTAENKETEHIKSPVLFIEVLPLLIADFVQDHPGIVVVDKTTNLRTEIKTLFDNEILHRLGENVKNDIQEEKINKIKELLFEKMNVENNMNVYEDLLLKNKAVGKNTVFIEGMLQKLKMQKIYLEKNVRQLQEEEAETENMYTNYNKISESKMEMGEKLSPAFEFNDDQKVRDSQKQQPYVMTKEEKRGLAIKEIFHFYAKQHQTQGTTFDEMRSKTSQLDISEFMKFCIEFRVPCKKEMLMEIFRKTATNTKHMTYEEFLVSLNNMSMKINEDRINLLYDRIKKLDSIGKETKVKTKVDYIQQKRRLEKLGTKGLVANLKAPEKIDGRDITFTDNNQDTQNTEGKKMNKSTTKEKAGSSKSMFSNKDKEEKEGSKTKEEADSKNISKTNSMNKTSNSKDKGKPEKKGSNKSKEMKDDEKKDKKDVKNVTKDSISKEEKKDKETKDKKGSPNTSQKDIKNTSQVSQKDSKTKTPENISKDNQQQSAISESKEKNTQELIADEITEEKEKIKLLIKELKNKTFETLREELLVYMELDDDKTYRKKMKGFILPFHSDKNYRIPILERNRASRKLVDPRTAEEIRRIIQKRKEEKLRIDIEKERLMKLKYFEERKKLHDMNEQKMREHDRVQIKDGSSYMEIKQKQINYEREKSNKITWDQLEQLNPEYFVTNKEDDFNPQALIGEYENDSDEEHLNNIVNKRELKKGGERKGSKSGFVTSGFTSSQQGHSNRTNSRLSMSNNMSQPNEIGGGQYASNTEKKAKEKEKEWENQKNKLLNYNDNMAKRGSEIVNKNKK